MMDLNRILFTILVTVIILIELISHRQSVPLVYSWTTKYVSSSSCSFSSSGCGRCGQPTTLDQKIHPAYDPNKRHKQTRQVETILARKPTVSISSSLSSLSLSYRNDDMYRWQKCERDKLFLHHPHSIRQQQLLQLSMTVPSSDDSINDYHPNDDSGKVEEDDTSTINTTSSSSSEFDWLFASPPLPDPFLPPLTNQERIYRKNEMMLLAKLNCGDDSAISLFKDHWFTERDDTDDDDDDCDRNGTADDDDTMSATKQSVLLRKADLNIGKGPLYWNESQYVLESLIRKDWTNIEARARLSKLLCLMGQFEISKRLSLQVLESKPWHFVALETMTAISTAQNDTSMIELWKSRRLPNPSQTNERRQWVDRALYDAEEILRRMEEEQDKQS